MKMDLMKLRRLRMAKYPSAHDFTQVMGVGRNTISNWERGIGSPRMKTVAAIAKALGVSIIELFPKNARLNEMLREIRTTEFPRQGDFADALGVHRSLVRGWESGRDKPDADMLARISELLDIPLYYPPEVVDAPSNVSKIEELPQTDPTSDASLDASNIVIKWLIDLFGHAEDSMRSVREELAKLVTEQ